MADDQTLPPPNADGSAPSLAAPQYYQLPAQAPFFQGQNAWRNLMLLGGDVASAGNARTSGGFLANPGLSAFAVGMRDSLLDSQKADQANVSAQNTVADMLGRQAMRQKTLQEIPLVQAQTAETNAKVPYYGAQTQESLSRIPLNQAQADEARSRVPYYQAQTNEANARTGLTNAQTPGATAESQTKQIGTEQARQNYNLLADIYGWPRLGAGTPIPLPGTNAAPQSGSSADASPAPSSVIRPPHVVAPELRDGMLEQATTGQGLPPALKPLLGQIVPVESGWNVNAVNKDSNAFGLGGILPATARQPGYGMGGVDAPASLFEPQRNLNFSARYLYERGKALGMTDADWTGDTTESRQKLLAVLGAYGGVKSGSPNGYGMRVVSGLLASKGATMPAPHGDTTQSPAPGFDAQGNPLPAGWVPQDQAAAAPAPPSFQVASTGPRVPVPTAGPPAASPAAAPATLTAPSGNAPSAPQTRPLAPSQVPQDPMTLTRAFLNGRLQPTPEQAAAIAPLVGRVNPETGKQLLEYALAGQKAQAEAQGKENWVADSQNGIEGQRNTLTGAFKPSVTSPARATQMPDGGMLISEPGGGSRIIPPNNPGVAARAAAAEQGQSAGKKAVTQADLVALGRESDTAIGNIDYGTARLQAAQKEGIPSGFFSPAVAEAAAAMKSLGISPKMIGVDPSAVGDVQTAQKTLAVVSGAILRQAVGDGSQITDKKIESFIHAQPDLANDPQALQRILGWARSQFVYQRELAMDGIQHANAETGIVPAGWQADYIKRKGAFAPIFDPLSQEMKQPTGQGPAADLPKSAPQPAGNGQPITLTDPSQAAKLPPGTVFLTPDGRRKVVPGPGVAQ